MRRLAVLVLAAVTATFTLPAPTSAAPATTLCRHQVPTIVGTDGDDVLHGTSGPDVIVGLGGDDRIDGGGGADVICGGDGDDVLSGGAGLDHVYGDAGRDVVSGDAGGDWLEGNDGFDTLHGGAGDDRLIGGGGRDVEDGDSGNDSLRTSGPDRAYGGSGFDYLTVAARARAWGGPDDDTFQGQECDHCTLVGGAGWDTFDIDGGRHLTVSGGADRDYLGIYDVTVTSHDRFDGGAGFDKLVLILRRDPQVTTYDKVSLLLGPGRLVGGRTRVPAVGIENAELGQVQTEAGIVTRRFVMVGTRGPNRLFTDRQIGTPTTLRGLAGNDRLYGADGDDRLDGGPGNDIGDGGEGANVCVSIEHPTSCTVVH